MIDMLGHCYHVSHVRKLILSCVKLQTRVYNHIYLVISVVTHLIGLRVFSVLVFPFALWGPCL